ncbi:MAG: RHS repeat-associated core domain-containing protein, partial [Verrucomicrobiota bacterium]
RLDYTGLLNRWGRVLDGCGYTEDPLGLRTNVTRNLGLTTNSLAVGYDSIGQLVSWSGKETGGALRQNEQFGFGYDRAHNLSSRTSGALIQTFNTDVVNQLTNITRGGALTVSGVTTVPAASVTVNGQTAQTNGDFTFASTNNTLINGQNSFTIVARNASGLGTTNIVSVNLPSSVALQYDLNGNLTSDGTRSFAYDAEDRLATNWVAGAWKSEFVYDGLGRRRIVRDYGWQGSQWVKTNETRYLYDRFLVLQERDSNNAVQVTYTRGLDLSGTLQYAGGIGGLLGRTDGNGSTFYHSDGAGNVTGLIDANENMAARYLYGPFGRVTAQWGALASSNAMQFSSMPRHANSGMSLYPFRAYDPSIQRWTSRDPIGEAGGVDLYGFVGNSPLNRIDPFGLAYGDWWDPRSYFGNPPGVTVMPNGDLYMPPPVNPSTSTTFGGMHGIDTDWMGAKRPGDFIADQAMEVAKDSALAMSMFIPLGGGEGAVAKEGEGLLGKLLSKCKQSHHPIPRFMGGETAQALSDLAPAVHQEFHDLLRQGLSGVGLPLDAANASAQDWARYFGANPGSQAQAINALLDASRAIDAKYGTQITQGVWNNLMQENYTVHP